MARWRLRNAHYLNVPGTQWEYKEVDRATGRQARTVINVPKLLNPEDEADCNYPRGIDEYEGHTIVVCHDGKGQPRDIVFLGEPTADMVPLDDEARKISKALEPKWKFKPDSEITYSQSVLQNLETQAGAAAARQTNLPDPTTDMSEMKDMMKGLMELNAGLISALKGALVPPNTVAEAKPGRIERRA